MGRCRIPLDAAIEGCAFRRSASLRLLGGSIFVAFLPPLGMPRAQSRRENEIALSVIRHPSKDAAEALGPSSFEARCARTSG
jgi:hypothetical protein